MSDLPAGVGRRAHSAASPQTARNSIILMPNVCHTSSVCVWNNGPEQRTKLKSSWIVLVLFSWLLGQEKSLLQFLDF